MEQIEFVKAKVINLNEAVDYSPQAIVSKSVIKKKTGTVSLFAFSKNEGLSEHTAPFDALAFIIDGHACITIGGQDFMLNAGEMIIMPANIPHALKAVEDFKMMLVMIRTVDN